MSLAARFERRLEGLVGGAFARVFKGQVEPVEIGTALQREAADKRNVMGNGQVLSPNRYRVTLSPSDHERLMPWEGQLTNSLAELVQEFLDENRWETIGDIEVYLARDDKLHTGVFGVASRMESAAPPRRRPYDSLSLPVVPGAPLGQYPEYRPRQPVQAPPGQASPRGPGGPGGYAAAQAGYPGRQAGAPPGQYPPGQYGPPAQFPPADPRGGQYPPQQPPPNQQQRGQYAPPGRPDQRAADRPAAAMLVVDQSNERHELRPGSNVIGRGTDSDLQLLDQGVSRRHVDIQYDGHAATAYDLGSTNGTSVNGHEISSQVLRHGDVIRVGHTRIVFHQERR